MCYSLCVNKNRILSPMKQPTSSPTSDGSGMMSHRDVEKYSKGFLLKSIQVIVESRLGEKISRKCCPNRNDWFNVTIQDDKDVEDRCLKALNSLKWIGEDSKISSGFSIDSKWKICCEISLKTSDDHSMVLEYWLFENTPLGLENGANGSPLLNSNPYSFVNVHNKMGTLIKSLMSLSRATPAFKLSSRRADDSHPSHVICYRVFQCDLRTDQFFKQIDPESTDHQHFGPEIRLGSVRSAHNVLLVTFCYRTELTRCNTIKDNIDYVFNLPCKEDHFGGNRAKNDSNNKNVDKDGHTRRVSSKQLLGAFDSPSADSPPPFPLLPETSLLNLIEPNQLAYNAVTDITSSILDVAKVQLDNPASEPIKIPIERKVDRTPSPTSSLDSFVFVENRPLFAAEEENDVESFFNGPSPSFTNSGDVLEEINEISNQLAAIESNAHQWDSFVDSVCSPDAEEDDEEEAKTMT